MLASMAGARVHMAVHHTSAVTDFLTKHTSAAPDKKLQ